MPRAEWTLQKYEEELQKLEERYTRLGIERDELVSVLELIVENYSEKTESPYIRQAKWHLEHLIPDEELWSVG